MLSWYQLFNLVEAALWGILSLVILIRTPCLTLPQVWAARLGAASFFVFGVTDILECFYQSSIPLWLWGLKCLCGTGILSAHYLRKGWNRFRWTDREFLFGLGCLFAVIMVIALQRFLEQAGWSSGPG